MANEFQSLDFIVTAKHYCQREGVQSVKERILKHRERLHKKSNIVLQIKNIERPQGTAVQARIELGQWIADCECGGAEFVDYDEPIFYCFSCGNRSNGNAPRPVLFPDPNTRSLIEQLVLMRPVDDKRGLDDLQRAHESRALINVEVDQIVIENGEQKTVTMLLPLTRSWNPNETIDDLMQQNKPIEAWHKSLKGKS